MLPALTRQVEAQPARIPLTLPAVTPAAAVAAWSAAADSAGLALEAVGWAQAPVAVWVSVAPAGSVPAAGPEAAVVGEEAVAAGVAVAAVEPRRRRWSPCSPAQPWHPKRRSRTQLQRPRVVGV